MVNVQLDEKQLRILRSALSYIFDEIEDDMEFERVIGATRWEAEELLESLPVRRKPK